ncbi:MAG: hypothetical protein DCC88_12190 [Spirobacillus cienkowskii]|jgi:hypothetical protein|uniref:Uncharacterized protein n=1 Tax=Spirobacillus cienkowskii TaxID=495820 RepID=A0A369KNW6_9BACT|nr:MAG: hypothetical protein DCC88_12190 [Spirobacillus cienkowskii]
MLKESIITKQQKNVPEVFNTESILQYTLSLHDAPKELKKRSILNREQDGHGFVSPTDIEQKQGRILVPLGAS